MKSRLLLFFLFLTQSVFATHIAGGEITYKYVSKALNNDVTYAITLSLYMDCLNGNSTSIKSDSIAIINVFDAKTGNLISNLCKSVARQNPTRVSANNYKCLKNKPSQCLDMYVYKTNIVLPERANGYIITFERCCRNSAIVNIISPDKTGSTIWTEIKSESIIGKNSSPTFKLRPPIFLCINAPFNFDHSATDEDGDSLEYEMLTPYIGASMDSPRPDYSSAMSTLPVFPLTSNRLVQWLYPFSVNNEIGGNPILEVNKRTGKLTVTPDKSGLFVMGIKVKEFRKGVLIGETKRDYQFIVANCGFDLLSLFSAPKTNQIDSVVSFINKSFGATSYRWDFGDPSTNSDTSVAKSPTYVYSKPGDYKITLIAINSSCSDIYEYSITVNKCNSKAEFSTNNVCESDSVVFVNKSQDAIGYLWLFGDGQNSKSHTPKHKYKITSTKTYSVTLITLDKNGCSDSIIYPVTIHQNPNSNFSFALTGTQLVLKATEQGNSKYQWKFGNNDSTTTTTENCTFILTKPEQYKVCLKVTNNASCLSQTCKDITVSILSLSKPSSFRIYPNPNNGNFIIEFEKSNTEKSIEILDNIGQIVYKEELNRSMNKLDMNLADGVYVVKITSHEDIHIQRLLVSKK